MTLPINRSFPLKPVSTYQFDFRGETCNFRINNASALKRRNEKSAIPKSLPGHKENSDSTYTTTNQIFYPPIRKSYRRKPLQPVSLPSPICPLPTTFKTSEREKFDSPELIHCSSAKAEVEKKEMAPEKINPESNERGTPLKWSRLPKEGCKPSKPSSKSPRSPLRCDCPCSCCTRSACRADIPVCICGIPCTELTGHPLTCNACLCYVFPEKPKALSAKHFCPRTDIESPRCPECKSILPQDPKDIKRAIHLPEYFNVPKTPSSMFYKIVKN